MKLDLCVLEGPFTIHRFSPSQGIPKQVFGEPFYSITKTAGELSVVCPSSLAMDSERSEPGWSCIQLLGPLDLSLVGILADISAVLAEAGISVFALSTFDTDCFLVKAERLDAAQQALQQSGYTFKR
jgi:uncharacterized protein